MKEFLATLKEILYWMAEHKWIYLAYWLPFIIFSIRFYVKNKLAIKDAFFNFIMWAKNSLETNQQADADKITAFMVVNFAYLPGRLYYIITIKDPLHLLYGSGIDALFTLVLYQIIRPKDIIELKSGLRVKDDDSTPKKEGDA
jgi:hypothetical protein